LLWDSLDRGRSSFEGFQLVCIEDYQSEKEYFNIVTCLLPRIKAG
jgi:hypothetical protein